jgi:glutathione synthase/RimK-type ligase-like ATP-grasp enzyme
LHPELTDRFYRSFAYTEWHATIAGLWLALDAFWVNHPMRNEEAARKPYQLKLAQQAGLPVPMTLITNNPRRARAFVHQLGVERTVYRTFSASANTWRETRLLQANQIALLDSVCYAPVVFQEYIPAHMDLRVIVAGEMLFAASLPAHLTNEEAKSSASGVAHMEPYTLPAQLATQLRTLMARLDLVYGVVHLRITIEGRHVFMGLDPNGPWLDVEEGADLPISTAIAQMLYGKDCTTASYGLSRFNYQR